MVAVDMLMAPVLGALMLALGTLMVALGALMLALAPAR